MTILNSSILPIIFISLFGVVGLVGCQSAPIKSSKPPPTVNIPTMDTPAPTKEIVVKEAQVIQWANGYDWQLQQVVDAQGNTITIPTSPPIKLEVAPDIINLYQGCQNYSLEFMTLLAPPFPYHTSGTPQPQSDCIESGSDNVINNSGSIIETLFPKYPYFNFNIQLISQAQPTKTTQTAPKRLALVIEHGNTFIFQGTPKILPKPAGLPITDELLADYQWRLVNAVKNKYDNNGKLVSKALISDFYHPDFPISLSFPDYNNNQYASFYSNCNYGVGGSYALLEDNTLLVGRGAQTAMSCGLNGDRVEARLSKLMTRSKSQLTLSLQPAKPALETQADFPHYNLLQTMETGETLLWQNEPIPTPKPYPNSSLNSDLVDKVETEAANTD
ncbi:hypothetical protein ES754_05690 [Psychrobacter frigidicola]|uniref:META domain-containing protein n=1 Tax=Psychrobacter frigidicola TaxID=45611 RepID=A0A5C7A4P2_9GAMM|nr:hypothetical protein [Psychrobacter frigidicola]TXD98409.1 hypothetical protein ES754_05690 [Psychrobacter frigidicola]